MKTWAIVPVKAFKDGKSRLARILSPGERAELSRRLLRHTLSVLSAVEELDRYLVVSRDPAVLKLARELGALAYVESGRHGLNVALTRATHVAAAQEADCLLILPADLPFVTVEDVEMMLQGVGPEVRIGSNGYYYQKRALAICPDHNREGTNALLICPPGGFTYRFGRGSFERHLEEGQRLGMSRRIVHAPGIKFDLDTEEDWRTYQALRREAVSVDS
jgi:2-phospho-L-lactate/phosphoenolpyruvate guanylyltransferase